MREAVPSLTSLPPDVIGLLVPCLCPAIAVDRLPLDIPVIARFVPGLAKPLIGRPALDIGLMFYDIPPPALDNGLEKDVPGRGA